MKFFDLLERLKAIPETEKDKEATDVLHNHVAAEVFQPIFDRGHAVGLGAGTSKVGDAARRAEAAEGALVEAQAKLTEISRKNPEAAELQRQYQSDLERIQNEHREAIRLKDEAIIGERTERAKVDLINELVSVHKVDKDKAEVLADRAENKGRIRFNAEGRVEVLQRGKDIAIVPSSEKGAIAMFAEELRTGVEPKFITSTASSGGEVSNAGSGALPNDVFRNIREGEKARQEQTKGNHGTRTAAERLGVRSAT